jgi:WD40 repeat protein
MGICSNDNDKRRQEKIKKKRESLEKESLSNEKNPKDNQEEKNNNDNPDTSEKNKNFLKESQNGMIIYLLCPDCSIRSPYVDKIYFDEATDDFLVNYKCLCNEDQTTQKTITLKNLLSNKEPVNECNLHPGNNNINFCKDCQKLICKICKEDEHRDHNLENSFINISKEEVDNLLEILNKKEEQFNSENDRNEENMEKHRINRKICDFLKSLNVTSVKNNEENEKKNKKSQKDIMPNASVKDDENKLKSNDYKSVDKDETETRNNNENDLPNMNGYSMNKNEVSVDHNVDVKKDFSCIKTFKGHVEKIVSLIQLSSGKLASGSYDNTIHIWNMNYEKEEKIINENGRVFALLEFENDKLLAGTSENVIDLWDVNSVDNNCLYSFEGHELWINCLVKINSKVFASASNDSKIKIWDYFTRTCLFDLQGHADCILSLILLRNNYLCSGSADLTIKIWDWEKQNCVSTLRGHQKWVKSVYELDNGILVSGSDDKTIKLWKDDNLLLTLNGHRHSVRTFCQLNENYFCSGSFDSTIKIWKINTWECIQTLTGHTSNVICVIKLKEGSKNNKYDLIASCSNDKTIKIWEGKL